jgi:hypothetical protein
MLNYPKMMMYGIDQRPIGLPATAGITHLLPAATWGLYGGDDKDAEWYQKNGFMYVGFDQAWYYKSADPTALPSKGFGEDIKFVDPTFVWDVLTSGAMLPDLTPTHSI